MDGFSDTATRMLNTREGVCNSKTPVLLIQLTWGLLGHNLSSSYITYITHHPYSTQVPSHI